jgi:hypothetical protein
MSWYQKNVSFERCFNKQKNLRDWPCVILPQFTWYRRVPKLGSRLIDAKVLELADSLLFLSGWCSNSEDRRACNNKETTEKHDEKWRW